MLLHGLSAGVSPASWGTVSPELEALGYCVFTLNYGLNPLLPDVGGLSPIQNSAADLAAFVGRVLSATGARKVDLVGASEGTFMPQYWLKQLGGAPKVDQFVALNPLYDGTRFPFDLISPVCGACTQIEYGSPMVQLLQQGGIAAPGVHYTSIMSRNDEFVIPYTSGRIDEPGQSNYVLQDLCPFDLDEHTLTADDPVAFRLILNAIDPAHAQPVTCLAGRHGRTSGSPNNVNWSKRARPSRLR